MFFTKIQEDVNGEKLTVKKWWISGADFSRFMQSFSRSIRDINSEKNISLLMIFFTVSFSRLTPLSKNVPLGGTKYVSFDLLWAFLGGLGRGERAALVRCLCKTQRSLHGRHF